MNDAQSTEISERDVKRVLKAGGIPDSMSHKIRGFLTTVVKMYSDSKSISKGLLTRDKKFKELDKVIPAARKFKIVLSKSTALKQEMIMYEALQLKQQVDARSQDSELRAKEIFSRAADRVSNDLAGFDRQVDRLEKTRKWLEQEKLDWDEVVAARGANKPAVWLLREAIRVFWCDNLGHKVSSLQDNKFLSFAWEVSRIAGHKTNSDALRKWLKKTR